MVIKIYIHIYIYSIHIFFLFGPASPQSVKYESPTSNLVEDRGWSPGQRPSLLQLQAMLLRVRSSNAIALLFGQTIRKLTHMFATNAYVMRLHSVCIPVAVVKSCNQPPLHP